MVLVELALTDLIVFAGLALTDLVVLIVTDMIVPTGLALTCIYGLSCLIRFWLNGLWFMSTVTREVTD
jgi:hypothetical protein